MPWPYDNRGGLLGRWQTPNQMRDPFQGFQAPPPPPQNYGQMPWDQSQGQGFDGLYKPKPQPPQQPWSPAGRQEVPWWAGGAGGKPTKPAARPQKPAATPQQPYEPAMDGFAMPQQGPQPPQQMPSQDAAMAAYPDYQQAPPQRAGGLGGLQPQQPMQYDASMAAYPEQPQVQRQPQPGEQATGNNAAGDGKLLGFDPMDWISMGLALMGGANQNGGDWSVPAQAMQNIQSRQYQEKRDAKEDERYKNAELRATAAEARAQGQYDTQVREQEKQIAADEAAVKVTSRMLEDPSLSPEMRSLLQYVSMNPRDYGKLIDYQLQEARRKQERLETVEDRDFAAEEARILTRMKEEIAFNTQDRLMEKNLTLAGAKEARAALAEERDRMFVGDHTVGPLLDNAINALKGAMKDNGVTNTDLFKRNMTVKQIFGTSDLQAYERWRGATLSVALGSLKSTFGPASSNQELDTLVDVSGGPTMSAAVALEQLERKRDELRNNYKLAKAKIDFIDKTQDPAGKIDGKGMVEWVTSQIGTPEWKPFDLNQSLYGSGSGTSGAPKMSDDVVALLDALKGARSGEEYDRILTQSGAPGHIMARAQKAVPRPVQRASLDPAMPRPVRPTIPIYSGTD
jgi:hypothetical protein